MTTNYIDQIPESHRDRDLAYVDFNAEPPKDGEGRPIQYVRPDSGASIENANILLSRNADFDGTVGGINHKPVLDIDFPVTVVPSSTPGHFHLYLDKELEHYTYMALLDALATAGIIEQGYARASAERGYTAVRLPWVKKEN